ncbi:MAG: hypothetical protein JWN44_4793 [Myxococcales bacterium]|nr:hypothetical protein [Myxococcales bacterium]
MTGEPDPHTGREAAIDESGVDRPGVEDPPWTRDAVAVITHEILGWLRALVAFTRAPRRFVADWADGRTRPLNPLAFALNGLTIAGPVTALIVHMVALPDDQLPFWVQVIKPLVPWAYNILWLVPVHLGLRLMGGRRRLRTTIGASFYAGGPMHIMRLFILPIQLIQMQRPTDIRWSLISGVAALVQMTLLCIYLTAALGGAHKLRPWRAALVILVLFVASLVSWGYFGIKMGKSGMRIVRLFIT